MDFDFGELFKAFVGGAIVGAVLTFLGK